MSSYATRIESVNDYVRNYSEKYDETFGEAQKQKYEDAMNKFNAIYGGIDTQNITDVLELKNLNETIPVFMGMGTKALESKFGEKTIKEATQSVSDVAKETAEKGMSKITEIGENVSSTLSSATETAGSTISRISTRIGEGLRGASRGTNYISSSSTTQAIETEGQPVRSLTGEPVNKTAYDSAVADLEKGGANGFQTAEESAINTAKGGKAYLSEVSVGELASRGVGGIGAGFEGFEAGKEITGSTAGGIGIGIVEAGASILAPEVAIPLMAIDVIGEGMSSLFHHHHKKPKPPPAPSLIPKNIPPPKTALSQGDVAVPVYNPSN